jgi:hypothetical protein
VDKKYGDDVHDRTGRDLFRLHRPGRTIGCIAAIDWKTWNSVHDLIRQTAGDFAEVDSKSRNPFAPRVEILPRYGRIVVFGSN